MSNSEELSVPPKLKYRFKDLKVYASTEWLADGKKKYRRVFESEEVAYLYVELSVFNKMFDEDDWNARIKLVCCRLVKDGREEICNITVDRRIESTEHVLYVREGWGHATLGQYWKKGSYIWEAYIAEAPPRAEIVAPAIAEEGTEAVPIVVQPVQEPELDFKLMGATNFYVEDAGAVTELDNPYFDVDKIRLYEGPSQGLAAEERKYLTQFDAKETRYVWVEFVIHNLLSAGWHAELIYNFSNSAGMLKGVTSELRFVREEDDVVTVVTGWGADAKGTWFEDKYTLEVIFMGNLIAIVPFQCGDKFVEGQIKPLMGEDVQLPNSFDDDDDDESNETLEELMKQLNELVGLKDIKKQIHDYLEYLEFLKIRKLKGFNEEKSMNLHSVFKGTPGTGKTTVARLLGKIYHKMGFLSNGKLVEVGRVELIGQYIGQTAPKVRDAIERARGGVLFIDEAYSLVRNEDDDKDYGREVVEILVKEMSDGEGDIAIFVAGYPAEMDVFLSSNPGLKSRFNVYFDFPDYGPIELAQIGDLISSKKEVTMTRGAREYLTAQLTEKYRERDNTFGNARLVVNIMDKAKMYMGLRIMRNLKLDNIDEIPKEALQGMQKIDLEQVFEVKKRVRHNIGVEDNLLKKSLEELNSLIGLTSVKKEINELVSLVRFYRESGRDVLGRFSFHTAFKGNPGTGKTTVARLLSRIFKALGVLERGHLIECDRQSLVAGFIGQTAIKTKEMIERAKGGVLFIDEAYSLYSDGTKNDFGKEAIEIILKEMEDSRGEFIVIVAGYPEPMDNFLKMNPGLKSRFDKELQFEDFKRDELFQVASYMFKQEKLEITEEAEEHLKKYFSYLYHSRDKFFGNARAIRKVVVRATKNQHLRMAGIPKLQRTEEIMRMLILDDVREFTSDNKELGGKPAIGFNIY